ncbi:UNVERIFIED_ORG: ATP-binding cassette subfamily C protein CydC [Comamonas terrigena]
MTASTRYRRDLAVVMNLFVHTAGGYMLLGALLATLTALAGMALLGLSGWFITATALAGLASATGLAFNVFMPSAGIRLLALGRTAGRYAERIVTHDATFAVLAALRERLFRGWALPQLARSLRHRPARLLFRLTQDIDALESFYLRLLVPAATALCTALLAAIVLGALDWRLGAAALAWLLLCGGGIALVVARSAHATALRRTLVVERLRTQAIDLVAGQVELAMSDQLSAHCRALAQTDARLARADEHLHRIDTRGGWLHAVAGHLGVAAVLLAVGALAGSGVLSAPLAALALLTSLAALEPIAGLRRGALEAGRSRLAARRLAPQLACGGQPAMRSPRTTSGTDAPAVHLEAVEAGHTPLGVPALRGINLQVARGKRIAVIGASGAGKSTLLALLTGELQARSGTLQVQPCTWLTQNTELFEDSLRDNLRLANPQATDEQLWDALRNSGLADDVRRQPQGLGMPLGEGGLGLSGGQGRRLALARLLLHPADFWLLDEPTEGLDGPTAEDVLARLTRHAGGRTVLIATHLRREARLAERIVELDRGRIVAQHMSDTEGFDAALQALRQH